jgi:hypothetical protein
MPLRLTNYNKKEELMNVNIKDVKLEEDDEKGREITITTTQGMHDVELLEHLDRRTFCNEIRGLNQQLASGFDRIERAIKSLAAA